MRPFGFTNAPLMKWPNAPPCDSIHAFALSAASGAGPYAIDEKISETLRLLIASEHKFAIDEDA